MSDDYNDYFDPDHAEIIDDYHPEEENEIILKDNEDDESENLEDEEEEEEEEEEDEDPDDIDIPIKKTEKILITYIDDDKRKTLNFMTKFEYTRIIGERAFQIENGEHVHENIINNNPGIDNALDLAELELNDVSVPFPILIERPINIFNDNQIFEKWNVRELVLPKDQINYNLKN